MSESTVSHRCEDGFEVISVANEQVTIDVVPALGARVISLRDRQRDREWLWRPGDGRGLFANCIGEPFERGPLAGIDECLPTITPCCWKGRNLPDHGECWSQAWSLTDSLLAQGRIQTILELPVTPFRFERTISLDGPIVEFDYVLTSRSAEREFYIWSFHPLLRREPGDRIELPSGCEAPRVATAHPISDAEAPVLQPDGPDESWIKAFVRAGDGHAALVRADGARLDFEWNSAQLPWLGVWITRGGWNGFSHLAIEPASGAPDDLSVAVNGRNCHATLPAAASHAWRICLRMS